MRHIPRWLARSAFAAALGAGLAGRAGAQQQPQNPPLVTRTFTLRHIRAVDAARLVAPYVRVPNGGVYEAGDPVQAVTVVETAPTLARIDSLLARERPRPDGRRPALPARRR